jgi:hypothetical protein
VLVAATILSSCSVYQRVPADTSSLYMPGGLKEVVLIDARADRTRAWRLWKAAIAEGSLNGVLVEMTETDALVARTLPGAAYKSEARHTTRCFLAGQVADVLPHRGYATIPLHDITRVERLARDGKQSTRKTLIAAGAITAALAIVVIGVVVTMNNIRF